MATTTVESIAQGLQDDFDRVCNLTSLAITATTVAFIIKTPGASIDVARLTSVMEGKDGAYFGKPTMTFKNTRGKQNQFLHCVVFAIELDDQKASIKVFSNGTFHMTGVKSFKVCYKIARAFLDVVKLGLNIEADLENMHVLMTNCGCKINQTLNLERLRALWRTSTYDKEHHVALKALVGPFMYFTPEKPYAKKKSARASRRRDYIVTALVFPSGSIIMCGAKKADDILQAYNELVRDTIAKHAKELQLLNYEPKSKKARVENGERRSAVVNEFYEHLDLSVLA